MPRALHPTRVLARTVTTVHGTTLVLTLTPEGLAFREPRRRTTFTLPYGVAFQQAVALAVAEPHRPRRTRRGLLRRGA